MMLLLESPKLAAASHYAVDMERSKRNTPRLLRAVQQRLH
jgi:hypothetical protein